jgi:hypothetical protein
VIWFKNLKNKIKQFRKKETIKFKWIYSKFLPKRTHVSYLDRTLSYELHRWVFWHIQYKIIHGKQLKVKKIPHQPSIIAMLYVFSQPFLNVIWASSITPTLQVGHLLPVMTLAMSSCSFWSELDWIPSVGLPFSSFCGIIGAEDINLSFFCVTSLICSN